MYEILFLLIVFLLVIFSVLLYLKNKTSRKEKLNSGICPSCGERTKVFYDENTKTTFKTEIIKARALQAASCSGNRDIEFKCTSCGLKEVHSF